MPLKSTVNDAESEEERHPLVSVIIPTHNYGGLIGETLDSLRAQTLTDWECIIVDDGSTDNTAEVVKAYCERDSRIRYFPQQQSRLQAAAKNVGLQKSAGRHIQFLDADDLLESCKLERQVRYLEEHPDVDLVYGTANYFTTQKKEHLSWTMPDNHSWPQISGSGSALLESLVRKNIMVISAPLVRRSLSEKVGLFDERLPPAEDWDYWLRCALTGARFQYAELKDTGVLIRIHSTSSSQNRRRMHKAGQRIRKKLAGSIESKKIRGLNQELRAQEEAEFAVNQPHKPNSFSATGHLMRATWFAPRLRWKAKLFVGAMIAPFISQRRLAKALFTPIAKSVGDYSAQSGR